MECLSFFLRIGKFVFFSIRICWPPSKCYAWNAFFKNPFVFRYSIFGISSRRIPILHFIMHKIIHRAPHKLYQY